MSSMGPLVYVIFATDDERAAVEFRSFARPEMHDGWVATAA